MANLQCIGADMPVEMAGAEPQKVSSQSLQRFDFLWVREERTLECHREGQPGRTPAVCLIAGPAMLRAVSASSATA